VTAIAVTVEPGLDVDPAKVALACKACDRQAREFAEVHGLEYTPVVFFSADVLEKLDGEELALFVAGSRLLTIQADVGPGRLGFHASIAGVVFSRVKYTGDGTWVTMSHEILEQLADPHCDLWRPLADGRAQALEVCDRVQGDQYNVEVEPDILIPLSNYLLPSAFVPGSPRPWDRLGRLDDWDGMTPDGFMIVRNADGSEVNVYARHEAGARTAMEKRDRPGSRTARRLDAAAPCPSCGGTKLVLGATCRVCDDTDGKDPRGVPPEERPQPAPAKSTKRRKG
jgi:hypothetical protein